jgi:hypothetical protein
MNIICSQQLSKDEMKRSSNDTQQPSYMILVPKKTSYLQNRIWKRGIIRIRASESIQLALNSTELPELHLVVARSDHWQTAVDQFKAHVGSTENVLLISKIARDDDIRCTFAQLPVRIAIGILHMLP